MFKTIRARLLASFLLVLLCMSGLGGTVYYLSETNSTLIRDAID
jgi:CHASE3 domain sensor protein